MSEHNVRREASPCSVKNTPIPFAVSCPECRDEVEMWSDESEAVCAECGCVITRWKNIKEE